MEANRNMSEVNVCVSPLNLSATDRFVGSVGMTCPLWEEAAENGMGTKGCSPDESRYPFSVSPCLRGEELMYADTGQLNGPDFAWGGPQVFALSAVAERRGGE